jgi:hypothetical protein
MRRRDFITLVGSVAVVSPLVARAQEPGRIYRLAFLIPSPRQAPATIALFDELRRNGFSEGQNLVVIPEGFEADTEHPSKLAWSKPRQTRSSPVPPLHCARFRTSLIQCHALVLWRIRERSDAGA